MPPSANWDVAVPMSAIGEARGDLLGQQGIERHEAHHAAHLGRQRALHGHVALIAVRVIVGGRPKLAGVAFAGPIGAPDAVRGGKLNDACKVADGHR